MESPKIKLCLIPTRTPSSAQVQKPKVTHSNGNTHFRNPMDCVFEESYDHESNPNPWKLTFFIVSKNLSNDFTNGSIYDEVTTVEFHDDYEVNAAFKIISSLPQLTTVKFMMELDSTDNLQCSVNTEEGSDAGIEPNQQVTHLEVTVDTDAIMNLCQFDKNGNFQDGLGVETMITGILIRGKTMFPNLEVLKLSEVPYSGKLHEELYKLLYAWEKLRGTCVTIQACPMRGTISILYPTSVKDSFQISPVSSLPLPSPCRNESISDGNEGQDQEEIEEEKPETTTPFIEQIPWNRVTVSKTLVGQSTPDEVENDGNEADGDGEGVLEKIQFFSGNVKNENESSEPGTGNAGPFGDDPKSYGYL